MSVISNIHTATVYDAKKSKAMEGQRLVVTIAKKDAKGNYGEHLQQTMCTSVPRISDDEFAVFLNSEDWQDFFLEKLQDVQNEMISGRIKEGAKEITTEMLSIAGMTEYLQAIATGDRWDAERVGNWFTENIAEKLVEVLMDKFPDDWELRVNNYAKKFELFAGKAKIAKKNRDELRKLLALTDSTDKIVQRFLGRLDRGDAEDASVESLGL